MNKSKKDLQNRIMVKKTLATLKKYSDELETKKSNYLELAKKAKLQGIDSQYNLAVSGLKSCIIQKKKMDEMALNIEIMNQMKDLGRMQADFLDVMRGISKEMVKITKDMSFKETTKQFEDAMARTEATNMELEGLLDSSSASFSSSVSGIDNKEIEQMINNEAKISEDASSEDIKRKIAEVDEIAKGLQNEQH